MYSSHRFLINRCFSLLDMISDDLRDIRYRHERRYIMTEDLKKYQAKASGK